MKKMMLIMAALLANVAMADLTDVYVARSGAGVDALEFDQNLSFTGVRSNLGGKDISYGADYAYQVLDNNTVVQLNKDTLQSTGVSWGGAAVSVDVGADGYVYIARGGGNDVLQMDPHTLAFTGVRSDNGSKGSRDVTVGSDFAFQVLLDNTVVQLNKDTLQETGVSWSGFAASVDVGANGFLYVSRGTGLDALQLDTTDLSFTGVRSSLNGGIDFSVGENYAYQLNSDGTIYQLDKDTLSQTGETWNNASAVSLDVAVIPEPATIGMLSIGAAVAMLIRRSTTR